jgi:anti-anti-sigma factor
LKILSDVDRRPIVIAVAGPEGSGRTTFCQAHLAPSGLRLVHAGDLPPELRAEPDETARMMDVLRRELIRRKESFIFQASLWDPDKDPLSLLKEAQQAGYAVVLCFIGVEGPQICEERLAIRVAQGGRDVPSEIVSARYAQSLAQLRLSVRDLPRVLVYDNSDPNRPFQQVALIEAGRCVERAKDVPAWVTATLFTKHLAPDPGPGQAGKGKLSLTVRRRPQGKAVLRCEGSVDPTTYKQFESAFRWCDKQGIHYVALDLSLLTYISSAALSLLIKVKAENEKRKGDLVLVRPQTPIVNIMRVLGLMDVFRVASSPEEALLPPPGKA